MSKPRRRFKGTWTPTWTLGLDSVQAWTLTWTLRAICTPDGSEGVQVQCPTTVHVHTRGLPGGRLSNVSIPPRGWTLGQRATFELEMDSPEGALGKVDIVGAVIARRICRRCPRRARVGSAYCSRCGDEWRTAEYKRNRLWILKWAPMYCVICFEGERAEDPWTVDHLLSRLMGGGDEWTNLGRAHRSCNSSKGASDMHAMRRGDQKGRGGRLPPGKKRESNWGRAGVRKNNEDNVH